MSAKTCQAKPMHLHSTAPLHIGDQVTVNNLSGTIRFIGRTDFKAGTWIGIELHKAGTGKNDGSVQGKRYFVCPPKTGLFILASKLLKQQSTAGRPSTPYTTNSQSSIPPLPSPPISVHSITNTTSSPFLSSELPPLPSPPNIQLEKRVQELLAENKQLKYTIQQDFIKQDKLENKMNQLRQTSVESIEILEKMLQLQYKKVQTLQKRNQELESEKSELEKMTLEAVETYERHVKRWHQEKQILIKHHQQSSQRHLKDIAVLESVLQIKLKKEAVLIDLIRKEKQHSLKLIASSKWSARLDTPIEEEEEEEEKTCSLCEKEGHALIQCNM